MYRVLITGDTHGHIQSVLDLMANVEFDEVIHLGDYVKDAAAIGNIYKEIPVHFVRGNNDFSGENEKVGVKVVSDHIKNCKRAFCARRLLFHLYCC